MPNSSNWSRWRAPEDQSAVGPLHDDAPEVRELVKQPLDRTEPYVLIVNQDRYLRLTHM